MFTQFETAKTDFFAVHPQPVISVRGPAALPDFNAAEAEIATWRGYQPTPFYNLSGLAEKLNIQAIHYKHEGPRFGLGSFKALGGAYAVLRLLQRELSRSEGREVTVAEAKSEGFARQKSALTVISATDGNHGRSVAWGAQQFGVKCRIYIHAEVSAFRAEAMQALGAEVIRVDGDYDATVQQTRVDAERHGWMIVSDTSWPGYSQAPLDVMAGYGVMAREIIHELPEPPTHVFLQGGVGGLAAAVIAAFQQGWGDDAPLNFIVEPELAPCLFASAKANGATAVKIQKETMMAGLSCGEPSQIAWDILGTSVHGFMTIPDDFVGPVLRLLARGGAGDIAIEAGESAVAGLIGLICAARDADLRDQMRLDAASRAVIIGSEGVTDPTVFAKLMEGRD